MNTDSQNKKILHYLQTHKKGITNIIAAERFGCYRLSGRIHNLREMGYDIKTIMHTKKNNAGHVVNYAEYVLRG